MKAILQRTPGKSVSLATCTYESFNHKVSFIRDSWSIAHNNIEFSTKTLKSNILKMLNLPLIHKEIHLLENKSKKLFLQ